ncbi:hypothetical protein [Nocardioides sp. URHA0032]|uniref:hypothetical protein n=1 Tax=Nocardioides sp. URHA0032 TaxID=1380388 RepID=UPI0012DF01E5|nr:hypothetical protein [Nocardioides sp. URHA0032]
MLLVTFDVALGCATLAVIVWLLGRRRDWSAPSRRRPWGAALLGTASVLMVACLPAAWGRVEGEVLSTSFLSMDARPADTFVGLVACLVTATLVGAHAVVLLAGRDSRVLVVFSLLAASAWAGLVVDAMLVASAVNEVAGIGSSTAADKTSGQATVGLAVWMALSASVLVAAAVIMSWPAPVKRRGTNQAMVVRPPDVGTQRPALAAGQPSVLAAGVWSAPVGELHNSGSSSSTTAPIVSQFLDGEPGKAHPNGEHR